MTNFMIHINYTFFNMLAYTVPSYTITVLSEQIIY